MVNKEFGQSTQEVLTWHLWEGILKISFLLEGPPCQVPCEWGRGYVFFWHWSPPQYGFPFWFPFNAPKDYSKDREKQIPSHQSWKLIGFWRSAFIFTPLSTAMVVGKRVQNMKQPFTVSIDPHMGAQNPRFLNGLGKV